MTFEEKYQQMVHEIQKGGDVCPILYVVSVIGQKWKIPILWQLAKHDAPMRFSELKRCLSLTDAMLSKTLDELNQHGLVDRIQYDCIPPKVEYTLSCKGKTLLPALLALRDWGLQQISDECSKSKKEAGT